MRATLLLRLNAPLQSWGLRDRHRAIGTHREPTFSGVVGMIAAGLGRGRDESIQDLVQLEFGVRTLAAGQVLREYQTSRDKSGDTLPVLKQYLADADFVVGLHGDATLIEQIHQGLLRPQWPLFLGRRSCPAPPRLALGISPAPLLQALRELPQGLGTAADTITCTAAPDQVAHEMIPDMPVSFDPRWRQSAMRGVITCTVDPDLEDDPFWKDWS